MILSRSKIFIFMETVCSKINPKISNLGQSEFYGDTAIPNSDGVI